MRRVLPVCVSAAIVWAGISSVVQAADARLSGPINSLFASGWKFSATALSSAKPHYEKAQAAAPQDPRPAYAMALIAIKNSKHDDARKWLNEALTKRKDDLSAQRAKIWIDLLTKQNAAALSGMKLMAESLTPSSSAQPEERKAMVESLGRMIGYLSGPAAGAVSDDELTAVEQEVLASLPRSLHVTFVDAKNEIAAKFGQLKAELGQKQESAVAEQTEQKNLAAKKLEEDKDDLNAAKESLTYEAQKAQEKYDAEEAALKKEIDPLARRLTALDGQARNLRNVLINVDRDIDRLVASAALQRGRDAVREATLLREADRLRLASRNDRDNLFRIEQEMALVRNQGAALEAKLRDAQARLQNDLKRFNVEGAKLSRTEKGLKAVARKVDEPVTGNNTKTRVSATKLTALSTYEEFPLESEKQRILDSLRK